MKFLATLTLLAALGCATSASAQAAPSRAAGARVAEWLRERLGPADPDLEADDPLRYTLGWADLNGDGRREAFAYLSGGGYCGSGGCHMYVLDLQPARVRLLGSLTITGLPIALLPTRTHGMRDFSVDVCGGGITRCYRARIQFDGWKYMGNPSMAWAVRGRPREVVVIGSDERARRLWPSMAADGTRRPATN